MIKQQCMNHVRFPQIFDALKNGPRTASGISEHTNVQRDVIRKFISRAHKQNLIHIAAWQGQAPVYAVGVGIDAPKPKMEDREVRLRKNRQKAEAKRHRVSELRMIKEIETRARENRAGRKATPWDALMMVAA